MAESTNVKVLGPDYQIVADGTLGWGVVSEENGVAAVLNLSGKFEIKDAKLTGVAKFFTEQQQGGLMTMGTNVFLSGQSGDTPVNIVFTVWGDTLELVGYFFYGEPSAPDRPNIITT